jgi:DNA-binding response OmpR family regulator
LIVDDEPATCEPIEKVPGTVGIESLIRTQSAEAPAVLRQGRFAIVFLDLRMKFPDALDLPARSAIPLP